MFDDRHSSLEQRCENLGADNGAVAGVVWVCNQCNTGAEELGTGGVDLHAPSLHFPEDEAVVCAGSLSLLELGLRHGGVEVDIPQGRGLGLIGAALLQET